MKRLYIFCGLFLIGAIAGVIAATIDNNKKIPELEDISFYPTGWRQ